MCKCTRCKKQIEKGKEAYKNCKIYCNLCYLSIIKSNGIKSTSTFWDKWVKTPSK